MATFDSVKVLCFNFSIYFYIGPTTACFFIFSCCNFHSSVTNRWQFKLNSENSLTEGDDEFN